jgi:hypothetical protein
MNMQALEGSLPEGGGEVGMSLANWEAWEVDRKKALLHRHDRFPLMRTMHYEMGALLDVADAEDAGTTNGQMKGLTINVSNGGLCLLMDRAFPVREVLKVHMPTPLQPDQTPTLAEVRWLRALPFQSNGVYVVGLKFLL